MSIGKAVKDFIDAKNPFAIARRKRMREAVINRTPTLLCPNCMGGILFHDLGMRFYSPTVNLMMFQRDFSRFVLNMDHYLSQELEFFADPEYSCPCAYLDDIILHFTHYKTDEEARTKWQERCGRINRNNMFVCLSERDGLTYEDMVKLGSLNVRGLMIFTAHNYSDLPYTLYLEKYAKDGEVGNILKKHYWNSGREYEDYFDFVKWMNEANGGDYDIAPFKRK